MTGRHENKHGILIVKIVQINHFRETIALGDRVLFAETIRVQKIPREIVINVERKPGLIALPHDHRLYGFNKLAARRVPLGDAPIHGVYKTTVVQHLPHDQNDKGALYRPGQTIAWQSLEVDGRIHKNNKETPDDVMIGHGPSEGKSHSPLLHPR